MLSTISNELSALKKKWHDDPDDYHRGIIAGMITASLSNVTVELGYRFFSLYRRRRW